MFRVRAYRRDNGVPQARRIRRRMSMAWWKLEYDVDLDEADIDHIADLIREGFTAGEIIHEEEEE